MTELKQTGGHHEVPKNLLTEIKQEGGHHEVPQGLLSQVVTAHGHVPGAATETSVSNQATIGGNRTPEVSMTLKKKTNIKQDRKGFCDIFG